MSHTPEPWSTGGFFASDSGPDTQWVWGKPPPGMRSGEVVARMVLPANAARIVSCINNCANLNPEAVPDLLEALRDIAAMLNLNDAESYASDDREGAIDSARSKALIAVIKATERRAE